MTVRDNAKMLADALATVLAATQQSADTIRDAPKHMVVWLYVDHCGRWHRLAAHLLPVKELGPWSDDILHLIEEAEQVLFDGREPWVHARRRKRFRESVLNLLQQHGAILHDAYIRATALASEEGSRLQ